MPTVREACARLPMWRVAVVTGDEGWALYAAEQERHAETLARMAALAEKWDAVAIRLSPGSLTAGVRFRCAKELRAVLDGTGCRCGHSEYDHSASNVSGCYLCECGVDA